MEMAKGGSSGENFQRQAIWLERKSRIRKAAGIAPNMTWRRRTPRHTPRKKILNSVSSDNVDSSPRAAVVPKVDDSLLMCVASSTGYSTDTFERDEEHFVKDLEQEKVSRKNVSTKTVALGNPSPAGAKAASFVFQKRLARIDWRAVHAIDVDRVVREVDIDILESVLDTIAFGDVQGEDTRNFTEANFVKLFRLAQLMVEYLLHVQELLADHKGELLQAGTLMQQKSEKIRSRFLWQRNTLLQTRHELKQAKKTLKTYEVMLKLQGKTQASQANQPQVRHCPFCEKVFESSYYLDLHVARRHQKPQEVTEDKILAVVSKAEEATAARVKAETSLTVQAEIQQLRERYQADLQRSETTSITQVRALQADLKQSNNQLHEVQARLEILQAQIISAAPNISQSARLGSLYTVEKLKEKDNDPDQERLYFLESKFTGLEHQVKTLGQENTRLLKELNVAYAEVSDLQSAKRQSVFVLETQVEDLRKENQHLKRTMSKVNNMAVTAEVMVDKPDELTFEAHFRYPGDDTMNSSLTCVSKTYFPTLPEIPQLKSMEVPAESPEIQDNETDNNLTILIRHDIPELIPAIIEAKEPADPDSDVMDLQKFEYPNGLDVIQPPNIIITCIPDKGLPPVHELQRTGESDVTKPFKKLQFSESVVLTNTVEEEPIALSLFKERRGPSPKELSNRKPDKGQALLALAHPASGRRRTEAVSARYNDESSEQESSPEREHYRHSTSPDKRTSCLVPKEAKLETSPERMRTSPIQRPKSVAMKRSKSRGDESPTTVEEMRAKLEREMADAHAEQKRRQKAVQKLLAKELEKEKLEERKKGRPTKNGDARSCKPGIQYLRNSKSETPCESVAPLLLALRKKMEPTSPSLSTINTSRKPVSTNLGEVKQMPVTQSRPSSLRGTRTQSIHSLSPCTPASGCKRSQPAAVVHPYVRPGLGISQNQLGSPQVQPRSSLHVAVSNSNPDLKAVPSQLSRNLKSLPKEDIVQCQGDLTRELRKYFQPAKPTLKRGNTNTLKNLQTTKPGIRTQEDEVEKRTTPHDDEKAHRIQEIAEVAAMDVGEESPSIPIPEKQKWLSEHPFVPIPTLPHVVAKYAHPETAFEKAHKVMENEFNGQLREELKKYGISSSTNGINETTYTSISNALEKQRSLRMSQIHGNERKLVEYERGAIVWHTQRAVHDRDMEIIESQFDVASGSEHDGNASDDSGDESGKSNYNSSRSHQSHKSDDSDCESKGDHSREEELKSEGLIHVKCSEQSSPRSSEIVGSSDDLQESEVVRKNEVIVHRAEHPSSSKADGNECSDLRSPPDGRVQYVSRAFSWKQKHASSRHNRGSSSRQPVRPTSHARQSEQGEEAEDELGLGDWDSDEDVVPSRGKQRRVQIDDRQPVSVSQDSPIRDLSPPKELLDLQQLKSSMASTSFKPTPPPSSPKSSTATASAENTCRVNFQKPIPDKQAPLEKDEALGNESSMGARLNDDGKHGITAENDDTDGSDDSDVEESKIFKELTSEIDEIISL